MNSVTLTEFYDMLEKHDWYYEMSDDHSNYTRGKMAEGKLFQIAEQSDAHRQLLEQFEKHFWSGPPWDTRRLPKPNKPEGL